MTVEIETEDPIIETIADHLAVRVRALAPLPEPVVRNDPRNCRFTRNHR